MSIPNRLFKTYGLILLCIILSVVAFASDEISFRTQKLSDRVLVLTEESQMENICVAIASKSGLIVIDTLGSTPSAKRMRGLIEKEFDRDDFIYVINTHHHWDHSNGNPVYPEATFIGHEGCRRIYYRWKPSPPSSRLKDQVKTVKTSEESTSEAETPPPAGPPAASIPRGKAIDSFQAITFKDRLTLDMGDLTLRMIYFGRAHSGSDILIHIPEEGILMTGDLFLERGWLPLFSGLPELDVPLWIQAIDYCLDAKSEIKHVIPGHRDIWNREKLVIWRDYIVQLWEGLVAAEEEGLSLEDVEKRFPLDQRFSYLKDLGHSDADLSRFHQKNIHAFWSQLKTSAAMIVEQSIMESGIEAGLAKYRELKSKPSDEYFFDESSFNLLGYRLLGQRKTDEAIEVFKLNIAAYPDSWNVYDSLAEAYMIKGDRELAIKYYKKSLEINPENNNAIEMLKRLQRRETE